MYSIKCESKDDEYFYYKAKNEYGQIIELHVYIYDKNIIRKTNYWNVSFHVGKRKHTTDDFEQLKIRGKDGIKSLLWGKRCLKNFIDIMNLDGKYDDFDNVICVFGTDKRRKGAYEYGLKDLGFKKDSCHLFLKIPAH